MTRRLTDVTGRRWSLLGGTLTLRTTNGAEYLKRWRLIQTPLFAVFLHRISGPDPGIDLHDHPWPFLSVVLRGGYTEVVAPTASASPWARAADAVAGTPPSKSGWSRGLHRRHRAPSAHVIPLTAAHAIVSIDRRPTWTLVVTGRRQRVWGFYTPDGWVDWRDYSDERRDGLHAVQTRRTGLATTPRAFP